MKISVFGTGYVGLVTGICFAEMGNEVICADIDPVKIEKLKKGESPIYEPGLDDLITGNIQADRVLFTTDIKSSVERSEVLFIAVGTPSDEDGSADMKYVYAVAKDIAIHMNGPKTIVTKSTVPIGTYQHVKNILITELKKLNKNYTFDLVSNPEFLREGCAIEDAFNPNRVVVGLESDAAAVVMKRLYDPFLKNGSPLLVMDPASAEMTKYAANATLATKISLMNEFSQLCEATGADIENVRRGIGSDHRIGPHFIYAGVGYGGSCFPKDIRALIHMGKSAGRDMKILEHVEEVNQRQRKLFFKKITKNLNGLAGKKIAIWGVAFKPGTDDIREAPALDLIEIVLKEGASVSIFDPVAQENTENYIQQDLKNTNLKSVEFTTDQYQALNGCDCLVIMTEWKSFREPNFSKIKQNLKTPTIFDGRNIYSVEAMKELGFSYFSIGRG
jgi:UDPglucose 6-dehydrogenase